jgi:hypothetical protein
MAHNINEGRAEFPTTRNSTNGKNLYSWLSPSGKILPVGGMGGHIPIGKKLLEKYYNKTVKPNNVYTELFNLGWVRVVYHGPDVYLNSTKKPSDRQIKIIIDESLLANKSVITWDNDEKLYKIWEKVNESMETKSKYLVKGVKIYGKEYNNYVYAYGLKDAISKITFYIIKDLKRDIRKDYGKIYTYILGNYYNGWVNIEKLPEQSELFDERVISFKTMFKI